MRDNVRKFSSPVVNVFSEGVWLKAEGSFRKGKSVAAINIVGPSHDVYEGVTKSFRTKS
jgi:hypothetical protein